MFIIKHFSTVENKKENRKGFWASLFSPKPGSCPYDSGRIAEDAGEQTGSCSGDNAVHARTAETYTAVKDIKVLGPGCSKCGAAYQAIEKVIQDNNLDVELSKIEDITEIMSYNVMGTPAVVVDGVVRIKGHVPSESEIRQILGI